MYLHPQKYCPSISKSAYADADAYVDADWCRYVLYEASFCNDADTDAYLHIYISSTFGYIVIVYVVSETLIHQNCAFEKLVT